jgi:hypothetical protein
VPPVSEAEATEEVDALADEGDEPVLEDEPSDESEHDEEPAPEGEALPAHDEPAHDEPAHDEPADDEPAPVLTDHEEPRP